MSQRSLDVVRSDHDLPEATGAGTMASMPDAASAKPGQSVKSRPDPAWRLRGMRIRKKLIILHTAFSLVLAVILLLALRPALHDVVVRAETQQCLLALDMLAEAPDPPKRGARGDVQFGVGSLEALRLPEDIAQQARAAPGETVMSKTVAGWPLAVRWDEGRGVYMFAAARASAARDGVWRLYGLLVAALVGAYLLIALTLEVFILPRQVYGPIRRMLSADLALQSGERQSELIDEVDMPSDELGEIMRSRNESVSKLRRQEQALADALERIELVATDIKRKNHLLETARRNLADQDRLVSLGMMSAGLAHEMNTPLAVLRGCVEKLRERAGDDDSRNQAELMLRVVLRLERLGESLLDFARVRPPSADEVDVRFVVEEAWTLVRLDRDTRDVRLKNVLPEDLTVIGDADRLTQVFVNLLRNAADAMNGAGVITTSAERAIRDGREWVSITCADTGPGIDPDVLPRLFEPFTSTRLDDRGTGLGLAVAEGIVREHGGVILARNAHAGGAIFEVMLPVAGGGLPNGEDDDAGAETAEGESTHSPGDAAAGRV
ncbi:MAG: hypothetical protein EA376_12295 [Phycisphaeraceae bacterium]|nr:MAG: hypothetical protein EA376_12295 [Phycisphaeraceae bacterium]